MSAVISTATTVIVSVLGSVAGLLLLWVILCLIGIFFLAVKPPVISTDKPSPLMGDDFLDYIATTRPSRINLAKLPYDKIEVVTDDGLTLRGKLYKTNAQSDITVICLHGYNSSGIGDFASHTFDYLDMGYNVLHVSHRHHGESDGKVVGFATLDRFDVIKWVEAINALYPNGKVFITGISMGGATAMQCSCLALPASVKGIIADCGYSNLKDEYEFMAKKYLHFVPKLTRHLLSGLMRPIVGYGMEDSDSVEAVAHAKCPILFITGDKDAFVPAEMTMRAYNACTTEKELLVIPGAGHAQAHYKDTEKYNSTVKAFIDKYK